MSDVSHTPAHFPHFLPIEFEHKHMFERFSHRFETYSDFNFNSFWSWNTEGSHQFSILNDNLVIMMGDYLTGETLISVLGNTEIDKTLHELFAFAHEQGIDPTLKLIPRVVIDSIQNRSAFIIEEDVDNHDYLFSIPDLAELKGNRFKSKRHAANKCEQSGKVLIEHGHSASTLKGDILHLLETWEQVKREQEKDVDMEFERKAISRILDGLDTQDNLHLTTATLDGSLVGFSIDELLPHQYVLSHYFKTVPIIPGISEYLNRSVAEELLRLGGQVWNWEQDLGLQSLRTMKQGHRPIGKQKKYRLQLNEKQ